MIQISIRRLKIKNFKGIEMADISFSKNLDIYGDNAAGKTSVYDAMTWLLFDKDSRGQKQFDIKPLGKDGRVKNTGAITEVECELLVNFEPLTLKKTYYEKWSIKRGETNRSFEGNTSDYYIDDVPCKKYEYEKRIEQFLDEEVFRLLTNVYYFPQIMKWTDRRRILFDMCKTRSDFEIMAADKRFSKLLCETGGKVSIDDYKKRLTVKRKGYSDTRNDIPIRLDECRKLIDELKSIDFDALEIKKREVSEKRNRINLTLLKLEGDEIAAQKKNALDALKNKLKALENQNREFGARHTQVRNETLELNLKLDTLKTRLDILMGQRVSLEVGISGLKLELEDLRGRRLEIEDEPQKSEFICPLCQRPLDGEGAKKAMAEYEQERQMRMTALLREEREKGEGLKLKVLQLEDLGRKITELEQEKKDIQKRLEILKAQNTAEFSDMPGYKEKAGDILKAADEIKKELDEILNHKDRLKHELLTEAGEFERELSIIEEGLAKEAVLKSAKKRIACLNDAARAAAEYIEEIDRKLILCDEFIKFKTALITDSINSRFKLARFKLFSQQINGGVQDCCDVTYDGITYDTNLNNGAKINVGLDIISTLSAYYGVKVPLFIDNAEGVTRLYDLDTQIIRLCVSKNDKNLRFENATVLM